MAYRSNLKMEVLGQMMNRLKVGLNQCKLSFLNYLILALLLELFPIYSLSGETHVLIIFIFFTLFFKAFTIE